MRPPPSVRPLRRILSPQLRVPATHHRPITTHPATFANIEYELLARPQRTHADHLAPETSNLLSLTLAEHIRPVAAGPLGHGDLLPQGHHLAFFAARHHPTTALLPDGTDDDHAPGPPFTRRLWAGGSVSFDPGWDTAWRLDRRPALCHEKVAAVRITGVPAKGREIAPPGAGEKVFVDVVREYRVADGPGQAITERRTLVFMPPKTPEEARRDVEAPSSSRRVLRAPSRMTPSHTLTLTPSPALLFRFSALTFNAHAIHLNPQHCRDVEGYRNLLVHGPLLLTLMFTALRSALPPRQHVLNLDYRNLAPVFVDEEMNVCVSKADEGAWDVWITGFEGGLCVKGVATVG